MFKQAVDTNKILVSKLTSGKTGKMKDYAAIFLISVGKDNFENEAVEAAIKMINEEFKECYIVLADTLQRHNIATENELSEKEAYSEALKKGDEWINKYKSYFLNYFTIPYNIIRWDSLINDPEFKHREIKFSDYIGNNKDFSTAMNGSINEYGNRLLKHLGEEHFNRIQLKHKQSCFSYLKEECVAITILPKITPVNNNKATPSVIVYPGKSTLILTKNWEIFIKNEYANLIQNYSDFLNWIPYRFNRITKNTVNESGSKQKINCADKQNDFLFLKQVQYINTLSEAMLVSVENTFNEQAMFDFKENLLEILLENKYLCSENKILHGPSEFLSIRSIAYTFANQLMSMFNTLEIKFSNQCKANIIRILKREIMPFINTENKINNLFVLSE
ncbi:MAG: hypothetical protein P1U74_04735 [Legionellaceae bacterium]|nr:hypothetical protein [Legionellaceae bacterium]